MDVSKEDDLRWREDGTKNGWHLPPPASKWQPYWKPGDLFRFWNSHPNTVYTILRFHKSRRPDDPVDWRERAEAIAADVQAANLGDGTVERVPVVILNSAQVCKVEA